MYESSGLDDDHELSSFDCGIEELNEWLCKQARHAHKKDLARTYVWTVGGDPHVKAYYSIAPTQINSNDAGVPRRISGGLRSVPGYILAKLALDLELHKQGLGKELLIDALTKIVGASEAYGGKLIVVDAIDSDAFSFYEKHDFVAVENDPRRLVLKIATAKAAFEIL